MRLIKYPKNAGLRTYAEANGIDDYAASLKLRHGHLFPATPPNRKHLKMFGAPGKENLLCSLRRLYDDVGPVPVRYYRGERAAGRGVEIKRTIMRGFAGQDNNGLRNMFSGWPIQSDPTLIEGLPFPEHTIVAVIEYWHPAIGEYKLIMGEHDDNDPPRSGYAVINFGDSDTYIMLDFLTLGSIDETGYRAFPGTYSHSTQTMPMGPSMFSGDVGQWENARMESFLVACGKGFERIMWLYYLTKRLPKGIHGFIYHKKCNKNAFQNTGDYRGIGLPVTVWVFDTITGMGALGGLTSLPDPLSGIYPEQVIPEETLGIDLPYNAIQNVTGAIGIVAGHYGWVASTLADGTVMGATNGNFSIKSATLLGDPDLYPILAFHSTTFQRGEIQFAGQALYWEVWDKEDKDVAIIDTLEPMSQDYPPQLLAFYRERERSLGHAEFMAELGTQKYPEKVNNKVDGVRYGVLRNVFQRVLYAVTLLCRCTPTLKTQNSYEVMLKRLKDGLVKSYKDAVAGKEQMVNRTFQEIEQYKNHLINKTRAWENVRMELNGLLSGGPDFSKVESLQEMLEAGIIKNLRYVNGDMIFQTDRIIGAVPLKGGTVDFRDFGEFEVALNIDTANLVFKQLIKERIIPVGKGFWNSSPGSLHPHINGNGKGCMGTLESLLASTVAERDYPAAIHAILGYLSTANVDDSAGKLYHLWPKVNPDGSPYDAPLSKCACGKEHKPEDLTSHKCEHCGNPMCSYCVGKVGDKYLCKTCENAGVQYDSIAQLFTMGDLVMLTDTGLMGNEDDCFLLSNGVSGDLCDSQEELYFHRRSARDAFVAQMHECPVCGGMGMSECRASAEPAEDDVDEFLAELI